MKFQAVCFGSRGSGRRISPPLPSNLFLAKQEVSIYEEEELSKLHAVCSPYHSTLYDFFLMSGFREQEAMHVTWNNVRFNANIIEMRWKPQFNWTPKAYKEREVPVPDELLKMLEAHRRSLPAVRSSAQPLVFSTANRTRDKHILHALNRNAKKAKLNPMSPGSIQEPLSMSQWAICPVGNS
ncbi:site-specific integrase [Granulicella sp. 5B5]|uniref:site-specific integrase n=1 Tax=Granulicella sp. 5B5 TaxID=1617967 RepID=UPI0015F4F88B|nr:site-specific integrase [Granulicella sp. 5B5]